MLVSKVMMSTAVMSMKLTKESRVYTGGTWLVCLRIFHNVARQLKQTHHCCAVAEVAWEPSPSHYSRNSTAETFDSENIGWYEMVDAKTAFNQ